MNVLRVPLASTTLGLRQAYRQSAIYGTTVHGMKPTDARAVEELEALAAEVMTLAERGTP